MTGRPDAPTPGLTVVSLVTDDVLHAMSRGTLDAQLRPGEVEWVTVRANERGWNAATALNAGIARAQAPWVVCAHQDVLFPRGWWERTHAQLAAWRGPLGVAGLVGVTEAGEFRGHVLDPHGHRRWGPLPAPVASLDEHVLVLPAAGPRFDPATPGFHCYGTDIARRARADGLDAIAIDAPVVHLSGGRLDNGFAVASRWLLDKWGAQSGGVIATPAALLSDPGRASSHRRLGARWRRRRSRRRSACRCTAIGGGESDAAR